MFNIVAHNDPKSGKYQTLESHLFEVAERCKNMGEEVGLAWTCFLTGLYHDYGKSGSCFQKYIRDPNTKIMVNHSSAGARMLYFKIMNKQQNPDQKASAAWTMLSDCVCTAILSHHGLYDNTRIGAKEVQDKHGLHGLPYFFTRLLQDNESLCSESSQLSDFEEKMEERLLERDQCSIQNVLHRAWNEMLLLNEKIEKLANRNPSQAQVDLAYYRGCVMRLVLSILREADVYNSANTFRDLPDRLYSLEETMEVWKAGTESIEARSKEFELKKHQFAINRVRCDVSDACKEKAGWKPKGFFTLELPTGAGKTHSVMRFAYHHAHKFKKNRIIYTTAYLSVLEQNAKSIRELLKRDEDVLEHHSNAVSDILESNIDESQEDLAQSRYKAYLQDSWESPIVLTTLVQLSNSLFGGNSAHCRRFSKLIGSILIMDEVQSLPLKAIYNFNLMSNFLVHIMNVTIIHCTATVPRFDSSVMRHPVFYNALQNKGHSLAEVSKENRHVFERVEFHSLIGKGENRVSISELSDHAMASLESFQSALIICNRKKDAFDLYEYLSKSFDGRVVYLTTNLCAKHRLNIIEEIKGHLRENRSGSNNRLVCVSTQLVEAGVDLDFDVVYRAAAGVDSLIQAAGRCNREGRLVIDGKKTKGRCYVYLLGQENLAYLTDIQATQRSFLAAYRNVGSFKDMHALQEAYFIRYYKDQEHAMEYLRNAGGSILELLSSNENAIGDLGTLRSQRAEVIAQTSFLNQDFKTAAESFELIDSKDVSVIVPFENKLLLDQLSQDLESQDFNAVKMHLRKLAPYSISLPLQKIQKEPQQFDFHMDDEIVILQEHYYDPILGYQAEKEPPFLML